MIDEKADAWLEDERTSTLYQVIGSLAEAAGVFDDPHVIRALDLAAYGKTQDGGDVLPFCPAYESARSAEPVASDITEEEIARALVEFQFPGCGEDEATVASHLPMARAVLAIVHPALERARVEERERCLAIVNAQTPDWVKERSGPYWDGYREAMEDASDDIRKAP